MLVADVQNMSSVEVFRQAANVALASTRLPAYVSYTTTTSMHYGAISDTTSARIVITNDGVHVVPTVQREGDEKPAVASPFPMPGIYDTMSDFTLRVKASLRKPHLIAYANNPRPLKYDTRTAKERGVDSVATSVRGYDIEIANDALPGTIHLKLQIQESVKSSYSGWFTDIVIDEASMLPTRVAIASPNDGRVVFDYGVLDGHWVIRHVSYHEMVPGAIQLGKVALDFESDFADYKFTE